MKISFRFKAIIVLLIFFGSFILQKIFIDERYESDAIFEIFEPLQERNETNLSLDAGLASFVGQRESSDTKYRIAALMDSKKLFTRLLDNQEFMSILNIDIPNIDKKTYFENFEYFHSNLFNYRVDARRNFYYVKFYSKDNANSRKAILIIFDEINSLYKEIDQGKRDELEKFLDREIFSSNQLYKKELLSDILLSIKSKQALYEVYDGKILRMLDEPLIREKTSYPSLLFLILISFALSLVTSCILFYEKLLNLFKRIT